MRLEIPASLYQELKEQLHKAIHESLVSKSKADAEHSETKIEDISATFTLEFVAEITAKGEES